MRAAAEVEFRPYDVICERYEVIRVLGAGGMATVILARDLLLERQVAIKVLRVDDPEFRQRLFNEARISARCQHENIVVHHADVHNGWPYIVLEHLTGGTVGTLLQSAGALPYARAVEIAVPVLRALQHMHARRIVHRDIKPDNIFIIRTGTIKVLDLGIAKLLDPRTEEHGKPGGRITRASQAGMVTSSELTRPGTILGTPAYMSPEQWIGKEIDQTTDLWACGILLFEMVCGRHPLFPRQGNELIATALLDTPMPSMTAAAPPHVPHALSAVVDGCLRKDKALRWQNAGDLLAALLPFLPPSATEEVGTLANDAETVIVQAPPFPVHPVPADPVPADPAPIAPEAHDVPSPVLQLDMQPKTIVQPTRSLLFVAADPVGVGGGTVGQKTRLIREELERGIARDRFDLVDCPAPEMFDLLRMLRKHRPVLVHFAGGNQPMAEGCPGQALFGAGGLYLRRHGVPRLVTPTSLQEIFGAAGSSVKLVVLDSSYTELHADALLAHVDVVVGTAGTAHPEFADEYARGLFGALGDGESVATAHRNGCAAWSFVGADDDRPQIKTRRGVDAGKLVLAR